MNILGVLKVLRVVGELIPVVGNIFAIFGRKKAEKKAKTLEKVNKAVIEGVEEYVTHPTTTDKKDVARAITRIAVAAGAEEALNKLVKRYTTPKPK